MSKFLKEAQPKVARHRHCNICHNPMSEMEKEFCSQKCEEQFRKSERTRKYTTFLMIFMFPVIILIMMLLRS